MRENRVLVLPVNILMVWHAGFTWPHDTLPCVLITVLLISVVSSYMRMTLVHPPTLVENFYVPLVC